jgi:SepF-like predicted cell division protein (DUF552 family)
MGWFHKEIEDQIEVQAEPEYNTLQSFTSLSKNPKFSVCFVKCAQFKSLEDVETVKKDLASGNILILNAREILESKVLSVLELKRAVDQIRAYARELGGSMGRIDDNTMIITPNPYIRLN